MKESTRAHLRHTPRDLPRSIDEATSFAITGDAAAPADLPLKRAPDPGAQPAHGS